MSHLTDLLERLKDKDASLAADLEREISALTERRAFGLNFERHVPEAVELPGRKVRKGDKVRLLPPRGDTDSGDQTLWRVINVAAGSATLEATENGDNNLSYTREAMIEDLVVVAEFRDPIYPGLVSTGKVERGGDKPFHSVINAENYHALQTLMFTHRGKIDCIYIDPPYNTGARDWKYNNDYVESEDLYRHSKWLAFMERRLLLARELLRPDESVLVVSIDEKEYLRLGLLLEQVFPQAEIQMVSTVINPGGSVRRGAFSRTDEYLFFVRLGESKVRPLPLGSEWRGGKSTSTAPVAWRSLLRGGEGGRRRDRPNMFYPIYVANDGSGIHSVGDPIGLNAAIDEVESPAGTTAIWPVNSNGEDGRWRVSADTSRKNLVDGLMRANESPAGTTISYLAEGVAQSVRVGDIPVLGRDDRGVVILGDLGVASVVPGTAWNLTSHNSRDHGSALLAKLLPGRKFPFPKSLYAVEDALRFFLADKPEAVVLDFFAGSGTTAHAVARLNKQDRGRRQSISVTNNEVSSDELTNLRNRGLRPGDPEWEKWGIFQFVTQPRVTAAVSGLTPDGKRIEGVYKFTDEFSMADGLDENVEFFTLTYESPLRVASHREFERIAPLLWMRAGSKGRRIDDISDGWDVADVYGVLADLDQTEEFLDAVMSAGDDFAIAFIVTDEDRLFESIALSLRENVEPVRLYESFLRNFEVESGRGGL